MSELWQDVRSGLRGLIRDRSFTVVAVLTLSLGIGATTAIFTVIKGVLLEPLPFPEPERLVVIQEKNPEAGFPRFSISPLNFRDYRAMSKSFTAMAARTGTSLALASEDGGAARRLSGRAVTADYLKVFGIPPHLGRDFTAEDDQPNAEPVIILGHGLWQDLGADPELVGQALRIDGQPTTVIGVLPTGYSPNIEALVPLAHDYESSGRGAHWLLAFGRLAPGVSLEQARSELETVAASLEATYPDSNTGWSALVTPLHERTVEGIRTALWMLMAAVGLVLLIACANVANLTLSRVAEREREVALRCALGAGRWRLLRQLLTESLLLALVAGLLGVFLAARGTHWLLAMNADDIPRAESIAVDGGVLVFALVATLGAALLFGLVPALQASRVDLTSSLKEGGRGHAGGRRGQWLRWGLVLGEVALAMVVLIGAGLLIRSFSRLLAVEPGFQPDGVWTAVLSLPDSTYPEDPERIAFYRRLTESLAALPGVEHAATVMPMPLSGSDWVNTTYLEGEPIPPPNKEHNVNIRFISPDYFDVLGIPMRRGRPFTLADNDDAMPVIVINESAARQFWPDSDPLGQRVSFGRPDGEDVRWYTVVGMVGDVHHASLDSAVEPAFYRSVFQDTPSYATIVLRTEGDPANLAGPLRSAVARLDPDLPLAGEQSARTLMRSSLAEPRFNTTLLGLFASLALVLATVGVFGVVSYAVTLRLREFGVRRALGARGEQIVSLVLRQAMGPVLVGIAIGLFVAYAATKILRSLVFGISTADPLTYALFSAALAAAAAAACLFPAWRATRIDPMEVLRDE